MAQPIRVGVVGCGNISDIYIQNLQAQPGVEVAACSARTLAHAEKTAHQYGILKAMDTDSLIQDPDIDVVLNITTPKSHYDICRRALEAGKHVYVEKPLSIEVEEGRALVTLARKNGLRLGCAPDTFLGGGIQTCRKLIDDGAIGRPLAAAAFLGWHGPESEHPNPAFLY
ncbi:MAG: Gfo/Idh/MocA family protein, partial [Butyricicoccus sp.]